MLNNGTVLYIDLSDSTNSSATTSYYIAPYGSYISVGGSGAGCSILNNTLTNYTSALILPAGNVVNCCILTLVDNSTSAGVWLGVTVRYSGANESALFTHFVI
jgi:hypothetical protein